MTFKLPHGRLEIKTRGLVCGPGLLDVNGNYLSVDVRKEKHGKGLFFSDPQEYLVSNPVTFKIVVRSRETKEVLWVRPFVSKWEALKLYMQLTGLEPRYPDRSWEMPGVYQDGELEYVFAIVTTYNSTTNNSGADWISGGTACPVGVTSVDWLILAGGASGGRVGGGGGAAGGLLTGSGTSVTPTTNYPVTVGTGGAGRTTNGVGNPGADSTWNGNTALKGGGGGYNVAGNGVGGSGTYGSGGGAAYTGVSSTTGGAGTAGQGNAGGNCPNVNGTGGGGGAGSAGVAGVSGTAGNGGSGSSSSISGGSVTYAGGGGGGGVAATLGTGGSGIGGNGTNSGTAGSGTANRGSGGGGAGVSGTSGAGSDGVCILSYVQKSMTGFNMPMLGM